MLWVFETDANGLAEKERQSGRVRDVSESSLVESHKLALLIKPIDRIGDCFNGRVSVGGN